MNPTPFGRNERGTTLMELIFGMLIMSIVVYATYKAWHYFDVSTAREKYKAELQRDIITVADFIERDIRMAGCGLPGNGLHVDIDPTDNDEIELYTNDGGLSTRLVQHAQPVHTTIYVDDASIFSDGSSVCLASAGVDTIFRTVQHAGVNPAGDDTLILTERINTAQPMWAGSSSAYPATKVRYEISGNGAGFSLKRSRNGSGVNIGGKLDSIEVKPKDDDGNILAGSGKGASVLTVVMGGYVGKDGNRVFLAESTEVNIRNNF